MPGEDLLNSCHTRLGIALELYHDGPIQTLGAMDPRKSQVVEMRFFGGLTIEETATALEVSSDMVMRDWRVAKAWLPRELSRSEFDDA